MVSLEAQIFEHLRRYRIVTPEYVESAASEEDGPSGKSVIKGLLRHGLVVSRPLFGRRVYYQATPAGAASLKEPVELARPLGRQALPRIFAVHEFCSGLVNGPRVRLRHDELAASFPDLVEQGAPFKGHDYYIEGAPEPRFTRLVVDLGGDYERLLRKLLGQLREAQEIPGLCGMMREGMYALRILTGEETKAQALRDALARRDFSVPIEVTVIPDLLHLWQV